MLPIRFLSRALPKSTFRPLTSSLRTLSTVARPSFVQSSWKPARITTYSSFSTSPYRREPATDSDIELAAKLKHERQLEEQSSTTAEIPAELQAFLDRSSFEITDRPGTQEVVLTRKFENETIKVEFSIADLNSLAEDMEDMDEDTAMEDEVDDYPAAASQQSKRTINQSATKGGAVDIVPEDSVAPADRAAQGEEEDITSEEDGLPQEYPIRVRVTITKGDPVATGAIEVAATAEDGTISVDDVYFYSKASLADATTPEERKEAAAVYLGPPFANLDLDLQSMLQRYIDERGINSDLAVFLPGYVEYKEQREYVGWLASMEKFIQA